MEIVRKYDDKNQIRYIISDETYHDLVKTTAKSKKLTGHSLLRGFFDYIYESSDEIVFGWAVIGASIILLVWGMLLAFAIGKKNAGEPFGFIIIIALIITALVFSFPFVLDDLADNMYYREKLISQMEVVDAIINGTELVEIKIDRSTYSNLTIKNGNNLDETDSDPVSIEKCFGFQGIKNNNNGFIFTVEFQFRKEYTWYKQLLCTVTVEKLSKRSKEIN